MRSTNFAAALAAFLLLFAAPAAARGQSQPPAAGQAQPPQVETWEDDFEGDRLDESKWELHSFEGGGGKVEVKDKQLRLRGSEGSRAGVRSRKSFTGDRFFVEAALLKVGERAPQAGEQGMQVGTGVLTVLFDGNAANRIEWLLRSDGAFEAWVAVDGRMERVDNRKLATKQKSPRLGVARRGDKVFFMLNGEVGLEQTVRAMGSSFKVMLYGFGTTENHWDSLRVQTLKQ